MKVQILGTGCPKCRQLYAHAEQAVQQLGLSAELEKVEDLRSIMEFGVMMTPALAVDGEVKTVGKVPSVEDIKQLLSAATESA